jgi:hypothetical protein
VGGEPSIAAQSYYLTPKGGPAQTKTVERVFTQFNGLREKPSTLVTSQQPSLAQQVGGNVVTLLGRATSAAPSRAGAAAARQPPPSSNGGADVRRALSEGRRLAKSASARARPERCDQRCFPQLFRSSLVP